MKPFAIYFPQFYATPTNDKAWGRGFTDWSLVANANLHERWSRRAPRRGYYDGSDPAVFRSQTEEMRAAGLGGMALYHYWFYTHQELDAVERTLLASRGDTVLPWFLVWASEGWSRRWIGDPSPIATLSREPSNAEVEAHCSHLLRCFEHPAYFRWRGKPLFVWYHLDHFAQPAQTVERYRACLQRHGVEPAIGHFVKNPFDAVHAPLCEATYLFEPRLYFGTRRAGRGSRAKRAFEALQRLVGEAAAQRLLVLVDRLQQRGRVYPADDFLAYLEGAERRDFVGTLAGAVQEVLSPGWNNTPRYDDRFTALADVPPARFGELVRAAAARGDAPPPLINAWNEWSEGAAIEPCAYHGTRYLDALAPAREPLPAGALAGQLP